MDDISLEWNVVASLARKYAVEFSGITLRAKSIDTLRAKSRNNFAG